MHTERHFSFSKYKKLSKEEDTGVLNLKKSYFRIKIASVCMGLSATLYLPLAGGPEEIIPTLFLDGFSDICFRIISAPGKSAWARRLLPEKKHI